jgi:predicted acylesterase/phospholipase RssA
MMPPAFNSSIVTGTGAHGPFHHVRLCNAEARHEPATGVAWRAKVLLALIASAHVVALQGCATEPARPAPSPAGIALAVVPGLPADARYWGDDSAAAFRDWLVAPGDGSADCCSSLMDRPHNYLVISSGGVDGAFGAGLLAGWTAAGTRPEFQLITGVSAGAMIAPFAFLGPAYDGTLREIYSSYSSKDLVARRGLSGVFSNDALMDTSPFRGLIDRHLGQLEIDRIAVEGRKGRKLLVGTTNLNSARPVVWDLTRIAASGAPDARRLIGDIILASCSIPGVFPPVRFRVQGADGPIEEMHVDGGVTAQLFLGPAGVDWNRVAERFRVHGQPQVYLVRNARSYPHWTAVRARLSPLFRRAMPASNPAAGEVPDWQEIEPRVSPILRRSMTSMLRTRGLRDAVQVYREMHGDELGFNLAHIPDDFNYDSAEFYDMKYMEQLFERGYAMAKDGYPWIRDESPVNE